MAREDLWLLEDICRDEPIDPLTVPAVKRHVMQQRRADDLGLQRLLVEGGDRLKGGRSFRERPSFLPRRFPKHRRAALALLR